MNLLKVAKIISITMAVLISYAAHAKDIQIFGLKKTLPLTDDEPVYHDFYINAGKVVGLKKGMILNVYRRETLYDTFQNKSHGDLKVSVGTVKIIHTQPNLSVARLYSIQGRKNTPILDYNYIMVGDHLDIKSARMDRGKPKKSASVSRPQPNTFHSTLEAAAEFASRDSGSQPLSSGQSL